MLTFSDDGKPVEMDMLLRQCLREFPHPHIVLLKQMVASLAKTLPVRLIQVVIATVNAHVPPS